MTSIITLYKIIKSFILIPQYSHNNQFHSSGITATFVRINALLAGVADVHLKCLQSVQNAAARLVSASRCCNPITPVFTRLLWLPDRQRIAFKTAVLVWKAQHGAVPVYLSDFYVPVAMVSGRQHLRLATDGSKGSDDNRPAELYRQRADCLEQFTSCSAST